MKCVLGFYLEEQKRRYTQPVLDFSQSVPLWPLYIFFSLASIHPPIYSWIQPSIHLSILLFRPPFTSSALWPTSLTNVCVGESVGMWEKERKAAKHTEWWESLRVRYKGEESRLLALFSLIRTQASMKTVRPLFRQRRVQHKSRRHFFPCPKVKPRHNRIL